MKSPFCGILRPTLNDNLGHIRNGNGISIVYAHFTLSHICAIRSSMKEKNLLDSLKKFAPNEIGRMVTFAFNKGEGEEYIQTWDFPKDGFVGNQLGAELVLQARLIGCIEFTAIVRTFLSIKTLEKMPNGKEIWIPRKEVCIAWFSKKGQVYFNSDQCLKNCCTDLETGKAVPPEASVSYIGWKFFEEEI